MTSNAEIESLASTGQRERLWQIDFLARFRGYLSRQDLADRFDIALSNATRDLTLYRELAPGNLEYNSSNKSYCRAPGFKPLFRYDHEHTLQVLSQGQARGFDAFQQSIRIESSANLNEPDLDILATLSRAICNHQALQVNYVSANSGDQQRAIVPHALINTGLRWHVRAFCRQHQQFRDFVLTRFLAAAPLAGAEHEHEQAHNDDDWNQHITLELVPHPKAAFKRAIELDYGLQPGATLNIQVRAATAGYLLRRWGVDCSRAGGLSPVEYQLHLHNRSALDGISCLRIAPGFSMDNNT